MSNISITIYKICTVCGDVKNLYEVLWKSINLRECIHLTADKNTYTSIMNSLGWTILHFTILKDSLTKLEIRWRQIMSWFDPTKSMGMIWDCSIYNRYIYIIYTCIYIIYTCIYMYIIYIYMYIIYTYIHTHIISWSHKHIIYTYIHTHIIS